VADPTGGNLPSQSETGVECDPDIVTATATEYELRNKKKALNFILGELVAGGQLSFIVANQPKDGLGCRGTWLFNETMRHFGGAVTAIQGNWTYGDNLAAVNRLTAGGLSLDEAAKQTFTGKRAAEWGFAKVQILPQTQGSLGNHVKVYVVFQR
jgi:hypothetical protein